MSCNNFYVLVTINIRARRNNYPFLTMALLGLYAKTLTESFFYYSPKEQKHKRKASALLYPFVLLAIETIKPFAIRRWRTKLNNQQNTKSELESGGSTRYGTLNRFAEEWYPWNASENVRFFFISGQLNRAFVAHQQCWNGKHVPVCQLGPLRFLLCGSTPAK